MKKHCCLIVIAFCLSFTPLFGQMILTDEDAGLNPRSGSSTPGYGVMVPTQNVTYDQWEYAPLGSCVWLLTGLGGAYLLARRKGNKTKNEP